VVHAGWSGDLAVHSCQPTHSVDTTSPAPPRRKLLYALLLKDKLGQFLTEPPYTTEDGTLSACAARSGSQVRILVKMITHSGERDHHFMRRDAGVLVLLQGIRLGQAAGGFAHGFSFQVNFVSVVEQAI
jgi:hypothetical protein